MRFSFREDSPRRATGHRYAAVCRSLVLRIDEACAAARELCLDGVGCIELCGAFGAEGAKRVIDATENKIPVGYVTHLPSQEEPYRSAFLRWRKKKGKSEKNGGKFCVKNHLFPVKRKKSPN